MGKIIEVLDNETTYIISGKSKELGKYINILDIRPEYDNESDADDYIVEWSEKLGFTRNYIDIKVDKLSNKSTIIKLVENNFSNKLLKKKQ